VSLLKSLWLDAVIGWNEGVEVKATAKATRARHRALRAQAAWNALNPHPFNRWPCLVHMEPDVNHCRGCAADRKAASA
jgi:hypothetical protein